LQNCSHAILNNIEHHADIQNNSYVEQKNDSTKYDNIHRVESKTEHNKSEPINVEKMKTVPDIGEVLALKMYTETKLLFALCKSVKEPIKQ
jgi:hypothetical protein